MQTAYHAIKDMRIVIAHSDQQTCDRLAGKLLENRFANVSTARNAADTLQLLSTGLAKREPIDLVLLCVRNPDRPGLDTFDEIHRIFDVATILTCDRAERQTAMEAIAQGADDYIVHPINPDLFLLKTENLLMRRFLRKELRRSTTRNELLFLNILAVMAKVLEAKDPASRFHSQRVSELASMIAREMGFQEDEVRRIGIAGILHDIGKLGISEAVLKKPGALIPAEREMVRRHPIIASTILEPIEQLQVAIGYIRHHHEHFEGNGYPDKLAGEQIPLGARIIHVAEAYDAMRTQHPYNTPRTFEDSLAELRRNAGTQFDPQVVEAAVAVLRRSEKLEAMRDEQPSRSLPDVLAELTGHSRS